jgi:hypothetical protein
VIMVRMTKLYVKAGGEGLGPVRKELVVGEMDEDAIGHRIGGADQSGEVEGIDPHPPGEDLGRAGDSAIHQLIGDEVAPVHQVVIGDRRQPMMGLRPSQRVPEAAGQGRQIVGIPPGAQGIVQIDPLGSWRPLVARAKDRLEDLVDPPLVELEVRQIATEERRLRGGQTPWRAERRLGGEQARIGRWRSSQWHRKEMGLFAELT